MILVVLFYIIFCEFTTYFLFFPFHTKKLPGKSRFGGFSRKLLKFYEITGQLCCISHLLPALLLLPLLRLLFARLAGRISRPQTASALPPKKKTAATATGQ